MGLSSQSDSRRASWDALADANGMFLILSSECLVACVNAIVKLVNGWSLGMLLATRCGIGVLINLLVCVAFDVHRPTIHELSRLLLRGGAYCAFVAFFWAALRSCVPIGDVVTLVSAGTPILLTLLARLLLHEPIPRLWPLHVCVCISGCLMVAFPSSPGPSDCPRSPAMLLPAAAAIAAACASLLTRTVREVPPPLVLLTTDLCALFVGGSAAAVFAVYNGGGPAALPSLLPPAVDLRLGVVVLAVILGWVALLLNVRGLQAVHLTAVASIASYASVPLSYTMQIVLFNEPPSPMAAAGALIVVASNAAVATARLREAEAAVRECQKAELV